MVGTDFTVIIFRMIAKGPEMGPAFPQPIFARRTWKCVHLWGSCPDVDIPLTLAGPTRLSTLSAIRTAELRLVLPLSTCVKIVNHLRAAQTIWPDVRKTLRHYPL